MLRDHRFEFGHFARPDGFFHDFPVLEEDDGRDGHDSELSGNVVVLIDVHFHDGRFAGDLAGKLFQSGEHDLARSAPNGPEVDEDEAFGNIGIERSVRGSGYVRHI